MPAETFIGILAATLLVTGWALWLLPIGTCSQCAHCRSERVVRDQENEAQLARIYGVPLCRSCGRHHHRGEHHRT